MVRVAQQDESSLPVALRAPQPTAGRSAAHRRLFTARIKRVRIRKRRSGSGFKIVARIAGDSSDSVASTEVTLTDAATGELIDTLSLDDGLRGKQVFTAQIDELAGEGTGSTSTISFALTDMIDSNGDPFGEQQEFEVSLDGLDDHKTAEDTTTDGWKIRVRVNAIGQLTLTLGNEDRDWGGGGDVEVSVDGGDATALTLDEVRQRSAANLTEDFIFEDHVIFYAEALDADGNVLDTSSRPSRLLPSRPSPPCPRPPSRRPTRASPSWSGPIHALGPAPNSTVASPCTRFPAACTRCAVPGSTTC